MKQAVMTVKRVGLALLVLLLLAPVALAQDLGGMPEWLVLLMEAFPFLGVIVAGGAVLVAAPIAKSGTEWIKVRLQKRMGDVPDWINHAVSATLSIVLTVGFLQTGNYADDPILGLPWPWSVIVFAALVFLRAGGWWDEKQGEALTEAGVDPVAYRTAPDGETKAALLARGQSFKQDRRES